jgi:RNA polymerase primary sigma factor
MSGKAQQQSRIKELITRGREQGYLTYAEVNDHLPEDISDPEQVEDIIRMINDMGINVFESAPDADALMLAEADTDEAAAEEAAALAAVETDIGRTTDPVRMYMREMGTVELLTREGEIEIAKRIEEGIREVMGAIAHFPGTVDHILSEYTASPPKVAACPTSSAVISTRTTALPPDRRSADPGTAAAKEDDDEDEENAEAVTTRKSRKRSGPGRRSPAFRRCLRSAGNHPQGPEEARSHARRERELALAELFMPIKLVPKQFEAWSSVFAAPWTVCVSKSAPSCSCACVTRACRVPTSCASSRATKPTRPGPTTWPSAAANTPKPWSKNAGSSLPAEADRPGDRNRPDRRRDQGHQPSHVDR